VPDPTGTSVVWKPRWVTVGGRADDRGRVSLTTGANSASVLPPCWNWPGGDCGQSVRFALAPRPRPLPKRPRTGCGRRDGDHGRHRHRVLRAVIHKYRPTVIVNNAGLSITGAIEDIGDENFEPRLRPWCWSIRWPVWRFPLCDCHDGRIVNVSSISGGQRPR